MSAYRDAGLFVLLSVLWGTAFVAISAGLDALPPVLFAAVRYDVAGALMLAYAAWRSERWLPASRADWLALAVGAALVIAAYNALLFTGQQHVTSGVAAILVATSPIWTTAFSRALLADEGLTAVGVAGLATGLAGVGLVVGPQPAGLQSSGVVGSVLVVLAAVSVALGSVLIRRFESDLASEGLVAWSTALGAIALHATSAALPSESLADLELSVRAVVAVAYLAVFASAVGYVVYFQLLDRVGPVEINLVSYAAPVVAAVAGAVILGESVAPLDVAGFLLVFVGFVLVKRSAIRTELARLRG